MLPSGPLIVFPLHTLHSTLGSFLPKSTRSCRSDRSGNAPRRIRHDAPKTTARFFPNQFGVISVSATRRERKIQTFLPDVQAAVPSVSRSLRTKTSTSDSGLDNHAR